jgi:hypothetical protein
VVAGLAASDAVVDADNKSNTLDSCGNAIFADLSPFMMNPLSAHVRSYPSYCEDRYNDNYVFHLSWYQTVIPEEACVKWKQGRLRGHTYEMISEISFTVREKSIRRRFTNPNLYID